MAEEAKEAPVLNKTEREFAEAYQDCFLDEKAAADAIGISIRKAKGMLRRENVREHIDIELHKFRLSREKYIRHLEIIAFGDIAELYEDKDTLDDETGEVEVRAECLKRVKDMPVHIRRRIKKLSSVRTKYGVDYRLELVSREKAIEILAKIHLAQEDKAANDGSHGVLVLPGYYTEGQWAELAEAHAKSVNKPGVQR